MEVNRNSRLWFACVAAALFFGASAAPVKTAVFTGLGPRGRGCVSWLQLVESSPELDLMLVDAAMIRAGALDRAELLVIPGGASVVEKKDLGPEGAARIRDFRGDSPRRFPSAVRTSPAGAARAAVRRGASTSS